MKVTFKEAALAKDEIEELIFEDPNIISIGVIAKQDEQGKYTDDHRIEVGVLSLEAYHNSSSRLSRDFITVTDNNKNEKRVYIVVKEMGPIKALSNVNSNSPYISKIGIPASINDPFIVANLEKFDLKDKANSNAIKPPQPEFIYKSALRPPSFHNKPFKTNASQFFRFNTPKTTTNTSNICSNSSKQGLVTLLRYVSKKF